MRDRLLAGAVAVPFVLALGVGAPAERGQVELTFRDPEIVESSGLVAQGGLVLTVNDSGDSGRVFVVDRATGETVGVTRWADEPVDVEALAPAGDGEVWVGDIGDNAGARERVSVTRVPVGRVERTDGGQSFELEYPHGGTDAEALLTDPTTGRLYVATKSIFGGRLFAAPATLAADRPNRLRAVGDVLPIVTDGAFFPDGRHLVLRDYSQAAVYTVPGLERVATFRLPAQDQGEGIAVAADGAVLVSSEGQFSQVLGVPLPDAVSRALEPAEAPASPASPSSSPSASGTTSREGEELPERTDVERPLWPWLLTGLVGAGLAAVLLRSLRPR
jgi:hypothetical protein